MRDLADCARETCEEMKWKRDSLVPALRGSKYEPAAATGRVKRDLGTLDAAAPSVPRFVAAAGDTDDGASSRAVWGGVGLVWVDAPA